MNAEFAGRVGDSLGHLNYTGFRIEPALNCILANLHLLAGVDEVRLALVVEAMIGTDGTLLDSSVYMARVLNHAKLAYNSVAAWLDGTADAPMGVSSVLGLDDNLRLQDQVAQSLKKFRQIHGALSLDTIEAKPVFDGDQITSLEIEEKNRAKELIEDFMIAANGVTARFLSAKNSPSIRRVVRVPQRWDRIVEVAKEHGCTLPQIPDSKALEEFLVHGRDGEPFERVAVAEDEGEHGGLQRLWSNQLRD